MSVDKAPVVTEQEREIVALDAAALAAERSGESGRAVAHRRIAVERAADLERPALAAVLFARTGDGLMRRGDVQAAAVVFESALAALHASERGGLRKLLESLQGIPKVIAGLSALEVHDLYTPEAARSLRADEEDRTLTVKLLLRLGNAYLEQPQDRVALARYEDALARPEIELAPLLGAHALSAVALVHRRAGRLEDAEAALAGALERFDAAGAPPAERRRAWMVRAGIERARGRTADALATMTQALAWYAEVDEPRGEGRALAALGDLHLGEGRSAEAKAAFERAAGLARRARDDDTRAVASVGLGRCLHREGALDAAAKALEEGIDLLDSHMARLRTEEGKVSFLESAGAAHDELVEVLAALPASSRDRGVAALRAVERARGKALSDLMGAVLRKGPTVAAPPERPWMMATQRAPALRSGDGRIPAPGRDVPPLPRIVFHALPDRTVVLAVPASRSVTMHVAPVGRSAWEERVQALRDALGVTGALRGAREVRRAHGASPAGDPTALLRAFHDDLVAPVEALFPEGEPIAIEPHGPLWLVPFAALLRGDGRWLGDHWPFVLSPSKQVLEEIRSEAEPPPPAELSALVVGNPTMPELPTSLGETVTLEPLPGALEEARAVAGKMAPERVVLLSGDGATRPRVEELLPGSGIVHIASHGMALPDDPLGSFVVLAGAAGEGGLLTARAILELSLNAVFSASPEGSGPPLPTAPLDVREIAPGPPSRTTDLVVLSACQTGLGRVTGDGVIGLSRAFLSAGARTVAVSLWSVSDAATAALMEAFYERYLRDGDKASALRAAMREVRGRPGWESPRFWAPFVLVGAER